VEGYCLLGVIILGSLVLGVKVQRWWLLAVPVLIAIIGVIFAQTVSNEDQMFGSERFWVYIITFMLTVPMFLGVLCGTIYGKWRDG
jgi:hypothetical protein